MNTALPGTRLNRSEPEPAGVDDAPYLAAAVRETFAVPCPPEVAARVRFEIRSAESAVRTWQAKWLFAVPVFEVVLLVLLRSDLAPALSLAGRLFAAARENALPGWHGCETFVLSWVQSLHVLVGSSPGLLMEALPWALAALAAATTCAVVILRQEASHA